ncbi:MAG: MFS transporter [Deltaproteobacteria bacterium]|nr:MFS transporter [Deltaproteobacteria bacterium]
MSAETASAASPSEGYRRYALGLLLTVYVFNFLDRQILTILNPAISRDLQLSDGALGFLAGPVFALFYTTAGIPIARWADIGVRRSIIALALFVWSAMTALSGLAQNLGHIAFARLGVGLGEAGGTPPAHSIISDLFPPERRASALSTYALGVSIGGALGLLLGGWLEEWIGWRWTFAAVGLPGIALALVVRLTLREPPRTHAASRASMLEGFTFMAKRRSFVHMASGAALLAFSGYGTGAFSAVFLERVHHLSTGEVGSWLGGIALGAGALGTWLGGALSDRFGRADARWYLGLPAIAALLSLPFSALYYLWPEGRTAIVLSAPASVFGIMYLGPTFAMTQGLVRPEMRALASAVLLFVINAIGLGLGPLFVGLLSDAITPRFGVDAIRYASLATAVVSTIWAAAHYALGTRTLREELRAVA